MVTPWVFNLSSDENDEHNSPTYSTTSSSSSSIGNNSDDSWCDSDSSDGDNGEENEVQSVYKHKQINLEEALPIKRGISESYNGRSKSFACVTDAASYSSIKEIAKPDNAYIRKRRNLLAFHLSRHRKVGISKKPIVGAGLSRSESVCSSNSNSSSVSTSFYSKLNRSSSRLRSSVSHNDLLLLSSSPCLSIKKSISLPDLGLQF
ncbi:protein OXIDATIVE STRESS 3 LIKE 1-like [Mercurialis annua]|uniref:protein OXIDATIVE STRESS 3 LIKE 1-like n=1 Tax=Mercurialis annua TaxID=3986 RepID=UPI00215EBBB1|nr:protein OXIDATIVE STRESS 3 LIKE 1-like [Mercurialis annua]